MTLLDNTGWPTEKPNLPFDGQGWCPDQNLQVFDRFLNSETKLVIELGAWLGLSTRHLLSRAKNAQVITIDTWAGSAEHFTMPEVKDKLPVLFEQFAANCWEYKDRLVPIRDTTRNALFSLLTQHDLQPDVFYIDASHAFDDVYWDLSQCRMFGSAVCIGDDWTWESVRTAVQKYCKDHYIEHKLHNNGITWWIDR